MFDANTSGDDVGLDVCTLESIQPRLEPFIMLATNWPVCRNKGIINPEANLPAFGILPPLIKTFHYLAYEIDEDVLVPDSREPVGTWSYGKCVAIMFVMAEAAIWFF